MSKIRWSELAHRARKARSLDGLYAVVRDLDHYHASGELPSKTMEQVSKIVIEREALLTGRHRYEGRCCRGVISENVYGNLVCTVLTVHPSVVGLPDLDFAEVADAARFVKRLPDMTGPYPYTDVYLLMEHDGRELIMLVARGDSDGK